MPRCREGQTHARGWPLAGQNTAALMACPANHKAQDRSLIAAHLENPILTHHERQNDNRMARQWKPCLASTNTIYTYPNNTCLTKSRQTPHTAIVIKLSCRCCWHQSCLSNGQQPLPPPPNTSPKQKPTDVTARASTHTGYENK